MSYAPDLGRATPDVPGIAGTDILSTLTAGGRQEFCMVRAHSPEFVTARPVSTRGVVVAASTAGPTPTLNQR